jgi:hypothetical protein
MKTHPFSLGWRRAALGLALAGSLALTSGCLLVAVGAAGAGAVAYVKGDLTATVAHPVDPVTRATERAIDQLQLVKVNESHDQFSAALTARTSDDKKVEIKITQNSDDTTKINIRVGTFGDESLSRAILEKIKGNL